MLATITAEVLIVHTPGMYFDKKSRAQIMTLLSEFVPSLASTRPVLPFVVTWSHPMDPGDECVCRQIPAETARFHSETFVMIDVLGSPTAFVRRSNAEGSRWTRRHACDAAHGPASLAHTTTRIAALPMRRCCSLPWVGPNSKFFTENSSGVFLS